MPGRNIITFAFSLAAAFNLVFNLAFVRVYGIDAAAAATVLSEVVLFVPLWRALRSNLDPTPLWQMAWKPACAAAGMGLAMLIVTRAHVLLAVALAPVVFWMLLLLLGAIQDEDRRLARRVLRRVS